MCMFVAIALLWTASYQHIMGAVRTTAASLPVVYWAIPADESVGLGAGREVYGTGC